MGVYKNYCFSDATNARLDSEYGNIPLVDFISSLLSSYRDEIPYRYTQLLSGNTYKPKQEETLDKKLLNFLYPMVKQYAPYPPEGKHKRVHYNDCVRSVYLEGKDKGIDWKNKKAIQSLLSSIWPYARNPA